MRTEAGEGYNFPKPLYWRDSGSGTGRIDTASPCPACGERHSIKWVNDDELACRKCPLRCVKFDDGWHIGAWEEEPAHGPHD